MIKEDVPDCQNRTMEEKKNRRMSEGTVQRS